jgi:hypothetical protein
MDELVRFSYYHASIPLRMAEIVRFGYYHASIPPRMAELVRFGYYHAYYLGSIRLRSVYGW